jgi:hypothetical protein
MRNTCAFLVFLLSSYVHSQTKYEVAIINDPDGFTFVRSGAGKSFPVVDTIRKDEFFYCYGDTNRQWINVQEPVYGKTGYMHRSRIILFRNLDSLRQHQLITDAFSEMVKCENTYWTNTKSPEERNIERDRIYEEKYMPAYSAMENLFCAKVDSILITAFFKTLRIESGSADEGKDYTSAKCWLCHPEFVDEIVCHWKNNEERKAIISSIETGMAMSGKEDKYSPAQLKKMYGELDQKCN